MNACLNLINTFLALEVKNNSDWLLIFLALEASAFSIWIYFLNLAVFGFLASLYNFSVLALLAFFHLNSLSQFFCHPILYFLPLLKLLDLLLRLFLA